MTIEQSIAQKLLQIKAIKLSPQNPFTWSSGLKSPIYCDNRTTLAYPHIRNEIKEGLVALTELYPDANHISGVATAGIPHGAILADELDLPFSYIRSKAKSHGRQNQIEGEISEGSKVIVVEDLISTGGSSLHAVEVIRETGAEVLAVIAIFDYQLNKSKSNFNYHNCTYHTLSNYDALLNEAVRSGYLTDEDRTLLESWNENPEAWSDNYNKNS